MRAKITAKCMRKVSGGANLFSAPICLAGTVLKRRALASLLLSPLFSLALLARLHLCFQGLPRSLRHGTQVYTDPLGVKNIEILLCMCALRLTFLWELVRAFDRYRRSLYITWALGVPNFIGYFVIGAFMGITEVSTPAAPVQSI